VLRQLGHIEKILRNLFRKEQRENELDEEMCSHLELLVDEKMKEGMKPEEALRAARIEIGGVEQVKEEVRTTRSGAWLDAIARDIRFGARMLRTNPRFTIVAVLTLALGIGGATTMFSIMQGWLLRPLHFHHPDRVVIVVRSQLRDPNEPAIFGSYRDFLGWRETSHSFESLAGAFWRNYIFTGIGEPRSLDGAIVTSNFFSTLGVPAQIGRTFGDEDLHGPGVVVLSHELWREYFNGSPDIVGESITLDGQAFVVLGVMPSGFDFRMMDQPSGTQLWTLLQGATANYEPNGMGPIAGIGRLRYTVSVTAARAELSVIQHNLDEKYSDNPKGFGMYVENLAANDTQTARSSLLLLAATVLFVLLISCVNLASLLLGRAVVREKEMAIRNALGSGRQRLLRQFMTESALLAALGAVAGIGFAEVGVRLFLAKNPLGVEPLNTVTVDWRALVCCLLMTMITTLLFGLPPALHASRTNVNLVLKQGAHGGSASTRASRFRSALVVGEVGIALILFVGAVLLARTLAALREAPLGYSTNNVTVLNLSLPKTLAADPRQRDNFVDRALEKLRALPGVEATGASNWSVLSFAQGVSFQIKDAVLPPGEALQADQNDVTPDYFSALGIQLLRGRPFSDDDNEIGLPVAILNESTARNFGGKDPIGQRIRLDRAGPWRVVIGVVGDTRSAFYNTLAWQTRPRIFVPARQAASGAFSPVAAELYIYVRGQHRLSAQSLTALIWSVNKEVPVSVDALSNLVAKNFRQPQLRAAFLGAFSMVALFLATIGVYGVVGETALQRTHEVGIRMALGARPRDVVRLIVGHGVRLALTGVVVGVAASLVFARLMRTLLYGVSTTDPLVLCGIALLLLGVAVVASYVPARQLSQVDPMVSLRHE
jgi:predicted permease